jgi:hypothetical protein
MIVVDGQHRRTCDDIPRWSCCNAPAVDGEDKGVFCNVKPPAPFDLANPVDLCHFCWETHYFFSRTDAEEAAVSVGAKEYLQKVAAFLKRQQAKKERRNCARQPNPCDEVVSASWQETTNKSLLKNKSLTNRYALLFSGQKFAQDAKKLMTHPRNLGFSLEAPVPGQKQRLFSFSDVKASGNTVVFSLSAEIENERGRNSKESNLPLPNRHLLLGLLKHWGCQGILELHVIPNAPITETFVKRAISLASGVIQQALASLPVNAALHVQPLEHSLVSSASSAETEASTTRTDFSIFSEPTVVFSPTDFFNHPSPTFKGMFGWQTVSLIVLMPSQESFRAPAMPT